MRGPARLAVPLVRYTSLAARRLRGSNPLSSSGKSADGALFHRLSPNPAGYGVWENNPGLGSPPSGATMGSLAGAPSQSAVPEAQRLSHRERT